MSDVEDEGSPSAVRAGIAVSVASICWTSLTSAAVVVLGLRATSVVLVAFGLTGLLDAAGSVALVLHFSHALVHEQISLRRERLAFVIVTGGLVGVGVFTVIDSSLRLSGHDTSGSSLPGAVIAGVSLLALVGLALCKVKVASRIPSRALRADAMLSGTGALLALVTVLGTALSAALGWWWADPSAALVVGLGALATAVVMVRSSTCGHRG